MLAVSTARFVPVNRPITEVAHSQKSSPKTAYATVIEANKLDRGLPKHSKSN